MYDIFCLVLVRLITCTSYFLLCARFLISSLPLCPVQLFIIASFKSVIDLKRSNIFPVKSQLNLDGLKFYHIKIKIDCPKLFKVLSHLSSTVFFVPQTSIPTPTIRQAHLNNNKKKTVYTPATNFHCMIKLVPAGWLSILQNFKSLKI